MAQAVRDIHEQLKGNPFLVPTTAEADASFWAQEAAISTRTEALALFDSHADAFEAWLAALPAEALDLKVTMAFGMGDFPVRMGIIWPAEHTKWHIAQLEYLQTCYGDRDWGF